MLRNSFILLLMLANADVVQGRSADGLLFDVSFETGFDANYAAGQKAAVIRGDVRSVPGVTNGGALVKSQGPENVSVSYKAAGNFEPGQGTVSFWLKPAWDTSIIRAPSLFKVGGVVEIYYEPSVPAIVILHHRADGPFFTTQATHKLSAGQWINIVYTWNAKNGGTLYLDTRLAVHAEKSWQAPNLPDASHISLDLTRDLGGRDKLYPLGGVVDELKIFDRILTAEEIVEEFKRCGGQTGDVHEFQMVADFGTMVAFDKLTWDPLDNTKVNISTIAGQTDTFATFSTWGGTSKSKWSAPATLGEDGAIQTPQGRYLKMLFSVRSDEPPERLPVQNLRASYRPIYTDGDLLTRKLKAADARISESINQLPLSDTIETPHIKWAKPYYRGKTKALVLTQLHNQREIIELSQRMELEFDTASVTKHAFLLAFASRHRNNLSLNNVLAKLTDDLKSNTYDVIVVGGSPWKSQFTEEIRKLVLSQVEQGAGMVVILDHKDMTAELENVLPLRELELSEITNALEFNTDLIGEFKGALQKGKPHFISTGIPFEFLPDTYYFKYRKSEGEVLARVDGDPLIALGSHGKGRVVQITYSTSKCWSGNTALTPHVLYGESTFDYWEYYLSMLIKSMLWAGRHEPELAISNLTPQGQSLGAEAASRTKIELVMENKGQETECRVELSLRDANWHVVHRDTKDMHCGANGAVETKFGIPIDLTGGMHFADIIIKNKAGHVLNWGSAYFDVVADVQIAETTFDREVYATTDPVNVALKLDYAASKPQNVTLRVDLLDTYDRLVKELDKQITVAPGREEVTVNLGNVESMTSYVKADFQLWRGDHLLDKNTGYFLTKQEWLWDDYCPMIWSDFSADAVLEYLRPAYLAKLKEMGFKAIIDECRCFNDFHFYAKHNMRIFPINFYGLVFEPDHAQREYTTSGDKAHLVRKPCMHDANFRSESKRGVAERVKPFRHLNPIGYLLADETSLTRCGVSTFPATGVDICHSPQTLRAFRQWLQTQYPSLEKLNDQWKSDFEDWDAVTPASKEELLAKKTDNYSSWSDHRTFMEFSFADTYDQCAITELKRADSRVPVGLCGTGPPGTYSGFDYGRLGPMLDTMWMYYNGCAGELWRSFNPDAYYASCQGYGQSLTQRKEGLWSPLLHKHKGTLQWTLPIFINADLTLSPHGEDLKVWFREINSGLGKILLEAEMHTDPIAILYSQPSIQAAWITGAGESDVEVARFEALYARKVERGWISGNEVRHLDNMEVYCNLLEAAGFQYNFVSSTQLKADELAKKGYKVLILPWSMAISHEEAKRIEKFVKQGGTLIADVMPGIMDGRCKTLNNGILDHVFGVKTSGYRPVDIEGTVNCPKESLETLPISDTLRNIAAGPKVVPTAANSLATFNGNGTELNTIYNNSYGDGTTILLNFLFSNLNDNITWTNQSALVAQLLAKQGNSARVRITAEDKPVPYYEPIFYRQGDRIQYLGVLRKRVGGDDTERIEIQLNEKRHVYDIRGGKYLGSVDSLSTDISPGEAALFALYPYRVEGLNLKVPKQVHAGESLDYEAQINTSQSPPGDHVVRIDVRNPQGELIELYSGNKLTTAGTLKINFMLALNDVPGTWALTATDVATGISARATFLCKTRRGILGPSVKNAGVGLGSARENTLQCAISKIIRTSLVADGT
jgi:hypothetical protein